MDRSLKERIVGATVLVVIAVLVVPVFLDGPSDEPGVVTETVSLPGQAQQDSKRQTIVLERDREQPVPQPGASHRQERAPLPAARSESVKQEPPVSAAGDEARKPEPRQSEPSPEQQPPAKQVQRAEKKETPAPEEAEVGATASATGMWAVQLGSFSNQQNAERLAAELRGKGYAAFLSRVQTSSEVLHRVRVGPQQNRDSADQVAAKLGSEGHKGQVVPHP